MIKYDRELWVKKHYGGVNVLQEIDILDPFPDLNEVVDPITNLYSTSLPIDPAILKMFPKKNDNCDYLEIGTWRGESLVNVSPFCNHCVSISLSSEEIGKFAWENRFRNYSGTSPRTILNVEHIEAN